MSNNDVKKVKLLMKNSFHTIRALACILFLLVSHLSWANNQKCVGTQIEQWDRCLGSVQNPDGSEYTGSFAQGKIDGEGLLTLTTGDRVLGQFKKGKLSGRGVLFMKNGSRYIGEFNRDTFDGRGILIDSSGERIEGIFKSGQIVTQEKISDPKILALLSAKPRLQDIFLLRGESLKQSGPENLGEFDGNTVYYFEIKRPTSTDHCVSTKWGSGERRNIGEGIVYWGAYVYRVFEKTPRESGYLEFQHIYSEFDYNIKIVDINSYGSQQLSSCRFIIATGLDINSSEALRRFLAKNKDYYKQLKSLSFADAEQEWLKSLGYTSREDYYTASEINWLLSGAQFREMSKYGVTNLSKINDASSRMDSKKCGGVYELNLRGLVEFLKDEAESVKNKASHESLCAERLANIKKEDNKRKEEHRKNELASPLLNCTKINCADGNAVESTLRNAWIKMKNQGSPYEKVCMDAIMAVKSMRSAGAEFSERSVETPLFMCNQGLKNLQ